MPAGPAKRASGASDATPPTAQRTPPPTAPTIATSLDVAVAWPLPGGRSLGLVAGRPLVMGILNVTPDSFSDGGEHASVEAAVLHAAAMLRDGAHVIDVGGESTRPGAAAVPTDEELRRVVPVLRALRREFPACILSLDTRKAAVARAGLGAGVDIVNDVSGGTDAGLLDAVRDADAGLVLMRSHDCRPHGSGSDVVGEAHRQLVQCLGRAESAGVPLQTVVLDPGLGFGTPPGASVEGNLALLRGLPRLATLGRPLLVGASRKRFIGTLTGVADPRHRVAGSVAAALLAARHGAALVRVHDVAETVQALRVYCA